MRTTSTAVMFLSLVMAAMADTMPVCTEATLADYLAMKGGCSIEGDVFSGFDYGSSAQGGATQILASGIDVKPLMVPGNPGLQFVADWSAGSGQLTDSIIGFDVMVSEGAALIEDASLVQLAGSVIGTGFADVGEGIGVGANCLFTTYNLSTLNTADKTLIQLGDHIFFSPTGGVRATKDIGVGGGQHGYGSVSSITDQFSEVSKVPEPASIILLGIALVLMGKQLRGEHS